MDVPGIVRERLGDEQRLTSVNVGGDDRVYVTPPRTLVYHASGLFSRESIEEYSHDANRFDISADRREATFAFEYDDGVDAFSVPRERIETVLPPVLAGVLRSSGWIDEDESVEESYRFGERTLVVTDRRLLTSVGEAVWDRDHESDDYADITGLDFEGDGLVIESNDNRRRIELDDEGAHEVYETLESALCEYHGIGSVAELAGDRGQSTTDEASTNDDDADRPKEITEVETDESTASSTTTARSAPNPPIPDASEADRTEFEPASADETAPSAASGTADSSETDAEPNDSGNDVESHDTDDDGNNDPDWLMAAERPTVADELSALRESVERQTEVMERNQELLERLIEDSDRNRFTDDQ